jgi:methylglutaconyl-CoA hydratase
MSEVLLIDEANPAVSVLTLNRPEKRNALSIELIEALGRAVKAASSDPNRRALILRGAGEVFCAGLDLQEAADLGNAHRSAQSLAALLRDLYSLPIVTIAAAHGAAFGGGGGLVAACDLAIVADDMRLGYPEVHRGLAPALVMCLLRRQIRGRALRELLLLGQSVDASEAVRMGLANRAAPRASVFSVAMEMAEQAARGALARWRGPRHCWRRWKRSTATWRRP